MKVKFSFTTGILFFIGILLGITEIANGFDVFVIHKVVALYVIVLCGTNIYLARNNSILLLLQVQLMYYNYSVIFSRYLHIVEEYREFYCNVGTYELGVGIFGILVFEMFMFAFTRKSAGSETARGIKLYAAEPNIIFSIVLFAALILIGIFGFDRSSFGNRGAASSLYEYSGLLFILGLYYLGDYKNKYLKVMYSLLIIFFVIQGFVFGERVASLQFMVIWAIFFQVKHINLKNVLIATIAGIMLMTAVGLYRASYNMDGVRFENVWTFISNRLFTFNGADLGYYCSLTYILVAERVEWIDRLQMFGRFVVSIFVGNNSKADLPTYTRQFYAHWYGGFLPLYFYFYTGYVGMVFACGLYAKMISIAYDRLQESDYFKLLAIYLVATAARWYMYSPQIFLRSGILFTIGYWAMYAVNKSIVRRSNNR